MYATRHVPWPDCLQVYAFGILLWEMVHGQIAFKGQPQRRCLPFVVPGVLVV
jgi:hypothetical protein